MVAAGCSVGWGWPSDDVSAPMWGWRVNLLGGRLVGDRVKDTSVGVLVIEWEVLDGGFVGGRDSWHASQRFVTQPSNCPPSWVVLMMWSLNSVHLSQTNGHGASGCVVEPITSPHVAHNSGSGQPHLITWLLCVAVRWSASLCCVSPVVISAVQSSKLSDQVAKPTQSSHDASYVS